VRQEFEQTTSGQEGKKTTKTHTELRTVPVETIVECRRNYKETEQTSKYGIPHSRTEFTRQEERKAD
jgi:hypothetical protein